MRRTASLLTALLLASPLALPVLAAGPLDPPTSTSRVWRLRPADGRPRTLRAEISVTFGDRRSALGVAQSRIERGRRHVETGEEWSWLSLAWAQAGSNDPSDTPGRPVATPDCPASAVCNHPLDGAPQTIVVEDDAMYVDRSRTAPAKARPRRVLREFYVYASNLRRVEIKTSAGWQVSDVTGRGGSIRAFNDENSRNTTYAHAAGLRVSHFGGASSPGGRYGSVAIAHCPYGPLLGTSVPQTIGGGYLWDGDLFREPVICGDFPTPPIVGTADGPTAPLGWSYVADMYTAGTFEDVPWLIVLDLPKA